MRWSRLEPLLLAAAFFIAPLPLLAQQRPTQAQARDLLRARPELATQLQQRLRTSGLTPDQVRARLRAEGYSESLLDAYLPGGAPQSDTSSSSSILDAVRSLGILDSADFRTLSGELSDDDRRRGSRDSRDRTTEDLFDERRDERDARRERDPRAFRDVLGDTSFARGLPRRRTAGSDSVTRRLLADSTGPRTAEDSARIERDSGLVVFGLDIFEGGNTQFEPNLAGPVDANYRLGPGDRLVLILTGDVERAHTLDVTREGFVVVPQVGQLYVANLRMEQFEDLLYSRLGRVFSGVRRGEGATTRFSVSVARLRSNQVFVVGDVRKPGSYRVSAAGTALTALYAAGGPTETGSLRRVEVRRGGRVAGSLDVYDYLLRGNADADVRLETGDVVFVPPRLGRVRVLGEVLRPATYEIRQGEQLDDLIRAAGGFTAVASRQRIQIERVLPPTERTAAQNDRVVLEVTAGAANAATPSVALLPGDIVRVFRVAERVRNRVVVEGNVWRPGPQGFAPNMRVSDALRTAGGLRPDVYLGQVLVSRLQPDSSRTQLRASLRNVAGEVINDFALQADDEIRVFSVTEFRPDRYVAITGSVRNGGQFPYREGMTVRDLVLLAGGLEEHAFLREAEVARLPETRANGVTASTFRVPLDSSYLFERGPDGRYVGVPGLPAPSGTAPEVPLRPYDNVLVLRQPDWELQRTVVVEGQVRYPGRYALRSKNERLTDVIERAGGLTPEAYAEGITFVRNANRLGRIGVDLPSVLRNARHRDNLLLQDGDSVFLPIFSAVVNVTGAVNSPVAVAYVPGADINFYIRAAGGPAQNADLGRAYVTQSSGKVESTNRRRLRPDAVPEPRPGSRVFVPERPAGAGRDFVAAAGAVAQILASLVAITVAVVTARRR